MKLVLLFYLEEDGPAVAKLLSDQGVTAYSRLPVEGHGLGEGGGWYGDVATHNSKMILAVLGDEKADALTDALKALPVRDAGHPIHLARMSLEEWIHSS